MIAKKLVVRRDVTSAADLRDVRRLSFFLSAERVGIRVAELSARDPQGLQHRLDRLQAVCGCLPAVVGLLLGVGFGLLVDAPAHAICAYGIGAAVVAKITTIMGSYFLYRFYLAMLTRAFVRG